MDEPIIDSELLGDDYRLFQNTPVFELAKAVYLNQEERIEYLVLKEKLDINFQEKKYGQSLLMITISNHQYETCKKLLELNADVNLYDTYNGTSAIIMASEINDGSGINTKFLKLLLKYGANPSDIEIGERKHGNSIRQTPLISCFQAIPNKSQLENIKILLNAGANINYKDEYGNCVLRHALISENMEVVYFLLQNGADFSGVFIDRSDFSDHDEKLYIQDVLKELNIPKSSEKYEYKQKIIEFLKSKGVQF